MLVGRPRQEERMRRRMWWPRTGRSQLSGSLLTDKHHQRHTKHPHLKRSKFLSCSHCLREAPAWAHAYRYTQIRLCICPEIGTARVHAFPFCRSSRWIIAAPKCLICSPGHRQISEPTNLIELAIPAGKGYRVAARTAQAE